MVFRPECTQDFEALFQERKEQIASFPGCLHLQMLKDIHTDSCTYFTYSYWESEQALEQYRQSDFFKDTWGQTKALFATKAEAWSVTQEYKAEGRL